MTPAYEIARERYGELGVDSEDALRRIAAIPISIHCWQGDDVGGFEQNGASLSGGLAVTGNYPGKARNAEELRNDLEKALELIPGRHRLNLHAIYAETTGVKVARNELMPEHFARWIDWGKAHGLGLDFNPSFFAHPLAADGWTLAHPDGAIRQFWIEHGIASRRIGAAMGRETGTPCVTNFWVPDGSKDSPAGRRAPRERLASALDAIFAGPLAPHENRDAVEPKLFGIGSESYVAGSHDFHLSYALSRGKMLCLDSGHYHPTESVADKLSAILHFLPEVLLHVSRGVRWDSDHVVTLTDELQAIAQEAVRGDFLARTHFGLDYFDASINRVAAWVIGTRALQKALLLALLEPATRLRAAEEEGDYTTRLALLEEGKTMPASAVWDEACARANLPVGGRWLADVQRYETDVLSKRG